MHTTAEFWQVIGGWRSVQREANQGDEVPRLRFCSALLCHAVGCCCWSPHGRFTRQKLVPEEGRGIAERERPGGSQVKKSHRQLEQSPQDR